MYVWTSILYSHCLTFEYTTIVRTKSNMKDMETYVWTEMHTKWLLGSRFYLREVGDPGYGPLAKLSK